MAGPEQTPQAPTASAQARVAEMTTRLAAGEAGAATQLGVLHVAGQGVRRDLAKARALFEQAYGLGDKAAAAALAALLASGAGGTGRDWQQSLQVLREQARCDADAARQAELIAAMPLDGAGDPLAAPAPEFISHDPLVVRFPGFMTPGECDELRAMATRRLAPATVVHPQTGALVRDPIRDSSVAAFGVLDETPFLHALNRRIAAASRSRPEQGEPTQVLVYQPGQQYRLHMDAIAGAANQRIQTLLVYLTDDFEGGATHFPAADLALRPPRGDAICFSNVSADMQPAASARHASLPVTSGTKVILSRWIRQHPIDLYRGI